MPHPDHSKLDSDAIAAVKAGDTSRFEELVERYQHRIVGFIGHQVSDLATAEDLAQDVFVRAFRGLSSFKGESSFSTWLIRIAINVVKSHYVSRGYKMRQKTEVFELDEHDAARDSGDGEQIEEELKAALRAASAEVDSPYREPLILCGFDGVSYEEAAAILKVPIGTVRSRLNRARIMLRKRLGLGLSTRS